MAKKLSKILSYFFHPVFVPFVGVFIILNISHLVLLPEASKRAILYMVAIITIFFPFVILPVLYYQKIISKVTVSQRRERLLPLFLTAVSYYFGYYMLNKYAVPLFLQKYMMAAFISVLLAFIISIKWKISLHMIGIGGLIGLLSAMYHLFGLHNNIIFMLSILVAGVIGTVRLYLKEHDSAQIYGGFLMGYIVTFGVVVVLSTI